MANGNGVFPDQDVFDHEPYDSLALSDTYFLGLSVLLIALGFYQARRAAKCNCKPSVLSQAVLWISALIVAISILLPQAFADLIERLL